MRVRIPNATIIRKPKAKPNHIGFRYSPDFEQGVRTLVERAQRKGIDQLKVTIELPFRPRSTGPRSQNTRFRGDCRAISEQLIDANGEQTYTEREIADAMKRMAVSEGYPTKLSIDGAEVPESEANLSVEQEKLLQDVLERFADEHELWLWRYEEETGAPYQSVGGRSRREMEDYWQ